MPQLIAGSQYFSKELPSPVVTIGNFDGVHLGHQKLLGRVIKYSQSMGVPSCVYTFEPSPRTLLSPKKVPRIVPWNEKIALLFDMGIDIVVVEPFTLDFAQISPTFFVQEILKNRLRVHSLIVGYDFRFGRARAGTIEVIKKQLPEIEIFQISALEESKSENIVSSTRIRQLLRDGDVSLALKHLSRPYSISGVIVLGDQRGRVLGFPTANIHSSNELLPATGVYAVLVQINQGPSKKAIVNLGTRPTFDGRNFTIEAHIFDFDEDIYGNQIKLYFYKRIRAERLFESSEAFVSQLEKDIIQTKQILESVKEPKGITFK